MSIYGNKKRVKNKSVSGKISITITTKRSDIVHTRIKELREEHGMGQTALADFVASSQQTISRVENEKCIPPLDLVVNIAKHFKVTVDYLLCLSDTKRNLEGQLQVNKEIDEFYEIVSVYKELNNDNRKTISILLNRLMEVQKEGD